MFTRSIRLPIVVVSACLVLMGAWGFSVAQFVRSAQAAAPVSKPAIAHSAESVASSSMSAPAAPTRFVCTISEVGTGTTQGFNQVEVGCNPGDGIGGALKFFAVDTADTKLAARMLSVALTAQATTKHVFIEYDPDAVTGLPCLANVCRKILFMGITTP
jgi:hypothetical protein